MGVGGVQVEHKMQDFRDSTLLQDALKAEYIQVRNLRCVHVVYTYTLDMFR